MATMHILADFPEETEALRSLEPVLREDFAGGDFLKDRRTIDASMGDCLSSSNHLYTCRMPNM